MAQSVPPGDIQTQPNSKVVFNAPYNDKHTYRASRKKRALFANYNNYNNSYNILNNSRQNSRMMVNFAGEPFLGMMDLLISLDLRKTINSKPNSVSLDR